MDMVMVKVVVVKERGISFTTSLISKVLECAEYKGG